MAKMTKRDVENMISIIGSDEDLKKKFRAAVSPDTEPVRDKGRLRR